MKKQTTTSEFSNEQNTSTCANARLCAGTKLLPMTDYVLERSSKDISEYTIIDAFKNGGKIMNEIFNYAKFLKQPIKLWMFVPCDEKDNPLKEPFNYDAYLHALPRFEYNYNEIDCLEFKKAKEAVLFKDCKYKGSDENSYFIYFPEMSKNDDENSTYNYTVVSKKSILEHYTNIELSDYANFDACT